MRHHGSLIGDLSHQSCRLQLISTLFRPATIMGYTQLAQEK